MIQDKNILKSYFLTGNKPTQEQYGDLVDTLVALKSSTDIVVYDSFNVGIGTPVAEVSDPGYKFAVQGTSHFSGNVVAEDTLTVVNEVYSPVVNTGRIVGFGNDTPTVSLGTGAGTGATFVIEGTDMAGKITVTTGTGCTANAKIFTLAYSSSFVIAPYAILQPVGKNAATLSGAKSPYMINETNISFDLFSNDTVLTDATVYIYNYHIIS